MSIAAAERAWCLMVPHDARGARIARQRLAVELADALPATLLADTISVLAELVGNAIRHADPLPGDVMRVAWRLGRDDSGVLAAEVRVTDGGAGTVPQVRPLDPEALDGRGLGIVASLARRWGVSRDGLGQSVWAELVARV